MKIYLILAFTLLFINNSVSQDLNQEATSQFKNFIADRLLSYKGDIYINKRQTFTNGGNNDVFDDVFQFKNLTTIFKNIPTTTIEKLNGVEWKGEISFNAIAWREILWSNAYNSGIDKAKWKEWTAFPEIKINFIKKRNKWRFNFENTIFTDNVLPKTQVIDQLLLLPMDDNS